MSIAYIIITAEWNRIGDMFGLKGKYLYSSISDGKLIKF